MRHLFISSNPSNSIPIIPRLHDNLAAALLHTDRRQEAIVHLQEALKIKPNDS